MKKISLFVLLSIAALQFSCSTTNYNEREIVGRWFSYTWLRGDEETNLTAWFDFAEDKTYRAVIARNQEEGKWWIEGYRLFTKANGADEPVKVKIEKLDENNLEISMNRSGVREYVIFSRGQ
jgi:hypothetical protein